MAWLGKRRNSTVHDSLDAGLMPLSAASGGFTRRGRALDHAHCPEYLVICLKVPLNGEHSVMSDKS